jgi:hypothetical protein
VPARGGTVVAREGGTGNRNAKRVTINENDVTRRIECDGTEVVINSNDCKITLGGACETLAIRGNDNRVKVQGSIRLIRLWGNDDLVTWSPEHNPTAPNVESLGNGNAARPASQ